MKRIPALLLALASLLLLSGCEVMPADYRAFVQHMPKSVLVLPPINQSADVRASNAFLSTISRPLAERGYYVFPVVLVDQMFKENGLPTPGDIHAAPLDRIQNVFNNDAVLYITIKTWTTTYIVLDSSTIVTASYRLVDARSGTVLWEREVTARDSSSQGQSNLIGMAIAAAVHATISAASEHEKEVARMANTMAFDDPNFGLLKGPAHPKFAEDQERAQQLIQRRSELETKQAEKAEQAGQTPGAEQTDVMYVPKAK